jgi:hypothetical protein
MRHLPLLLVLCAALPIRAEIGCACDASKPETLQARECSLCREAEALPLDPPVFVLKDASPRKPQRWLTLPRSHGQRGAEALAGRTAQERLLLWTAAIEKAKSLWGEEWGLAINGVTTRTQCHTHIHVGKLLKGVETGRFIVVDGPAKIPAPEDDSGLWVHPVGRKLHVHLGEQITETVLLR